MDRLLLDTTVLIDLSKDHGSVARTLGALVDSGAILSVCAVSVAEFMTGVPVPERQRWQRWIADFAYWDISREAAALAGILRHNSARQGRALHLPDALMAATAMITDSVLLTNNVKDYQLPELKTLQLGG